MIVDGPEGPALRLRSCSESTSDALRTSVTATWSADGSALLLTAGTPLIAAELCITGLCAGEAPCETRRDGKGLRLREWGGSSRRCFQTALPVLLEPSSGEGCGCCGQSASRSSWSGRSGLAKGIGEAGAELRSSRSARRGEQARREQARRELSGAEELAEQADDSEPVRLGGAWTESLPARRIASIS